MILAHQIRLCPTEAQERYFKRACGTARFTYNWALAEWKRSYAAGEKPNGRSLKQRFNALRKAQFPWTYEVHRDCTARPFDNLQKAFNGLFRKTSKYPKFKKRGQHDIFYIANDKLTLDGSKVRIPLLGWVKMRETLRFTGKIVGATVRRIADGWFITVQVDVDDYRKDRTGDGIVGVDLGILCSAKISTGETFDGPRPLRVLQSKLQRLSRQHSRKCKGSANRRKSALKLARLHRRITWIRQNSLHMLTTKLCRENQAIGIEDLHVKGMLQNHKLAKALSDESFGESRRQLTYKSVIYNTQLHVADRWFPSSKKCSRCGKINEHLKLSDRVFRCECGLEINRDLNAAINLVPWVTRELTPVDMEALVDAGTDVLTKLPWVKQEFQGAHNCALGK